VSQWQDFLKPDELEILKQTEAWIERPQGLVGKALGFLGKPLDMAYDRVPAGVKESIGQAIYGVLAKVANVSEGHVRPQQIFDMLSQQAGLDVTRVDQVSRLPIQALDKIARKVINAHRATALVEGGATGAAGLPGLVADIPALYYLVFRSVQEVALCYGFAPDAPDEMDHIFKVVDVGHYLESEKKRKGMLEIERLQDMISSNAPLKDVERTMIAKTLQTLARQLATAITRRKLAQTVALVGGLVGASVNQALLADVGDTAFYAYRRRFLMREAQARQARDQANA